MIKRSTLLTFPILIAMTFSQCKSSQQTVGNCRKVILNESYLPKESGIVTITNQRITRSGNQLILSGDQITSNCKLIWDGKMAKSYPPIVFLHVEQNGNKKAKRISCFDISELINRTKKTPVRLQVAGFEQEILLEK